MSRVSFKNAGGDLVKAVVLPDDVTLAGLHDYVADNVELPAPLDLQVLVLGLWDPHHMTFYPLNDLSLKPLVQLVNKGGGNEEISVYLLTKEDVKATTLNGGP